MILLNGRIPQGGGRSLADADIPIVAVCEANPGATIPQVEVQNREAARSAVAHLVELGHRRIAYLAGPWGNILEHERRAGFCLGLVTPFSGRPLLSADFTFRTGVAAAVRFLAQRHVQQRCSRRMTKWRSALSRRSTPPASMFQMISRSWGSMGSSSPTMRNRRLRPFVNRVVSWVGPVPRS